MAAQTLGLRTMQPEALNDLVEGKFVDALRSVAAGMTMNELHEQRADFVQKVQQASSADLAMNGLELESVSLTGLDQTSIEHFNANNAFDAEGLTKLTEQIELRKKARNDIEQDTRVQMETKNLEADQASFEIGRDNEFARLEQEREVEMRRAKQSSEVAREQAERNREAEAARITAKKEVDAQQIEADRTVEEARIDQVRALEIARQEQQIAVQNKSREESQAKAEADAARATAVAAEEGVLTAKETEIADRDKRIELIEAAKIAERDAIKIKVEAEAEKDAASNRAEAIRLEASGEAEAEKLRAEAARIRFEVEAAGQQAINEAANILSMDQISLQTKLALLKVLPEVVAFPKAHIVLNPRESRLFIRTEASTSDWTLNQLSAVKLESIFLEYTQVGSALDPSSFRSIGVGGRFSLKQTHVSALLQAPITGGDPARWQLVAASSTPLVQGLSDLGEWWFGRNAINARV